MAHQTSMTTPKIQTIGNKVSQWGEGPIWWGDQLLYVDIKGHKIIRLDPESGNEAQWDVGELIGTVVPTEHEDEVIYAGDSGCIRYNLRDGHKTPLADPESELRGKNRFNDGKCDPAGRFWAGTISMVKNTGSANLYCLDCDGSLSHKAADITNSNGICWTVDAKMMYYIDTPTQQVRAYDYHQASGNISNPRVAIDTAAQGYASSPDGMTIDAEDMLWVAFCHGGCVVRFDPSTGKELQRVDLPCIETTACAFGGKHMDRLFVTTGIKPDLDEPDAGKVFVIDGLCIRGVPTVPYKG
tara:strand:+ start:9532 stop:10425 length:894 start_codon:yes stop_codon:yes gene_type:complete